MSNWGQKILHGKFILAHSLAEKQAKKSDFLKTFTRTQYAKCSMHKTIKFCWDEVINMRNLGRYLHFHYTFIKDVYRARLFKCDLLRISIGIHPPQSRTLPAFFSSSRSNWVGKSTTVHRYNAMLAQWGIPNMVSFHKG